MRSRRVRQMVAVLIVAAQVAACGGATPSAPSASGDPPSATTSATASASGSVPSGSGPDRLPLVDFAETDDPAAAAQRELDLVRETRDDAGMPALIGSQGAAAFSTLDQIEAAFGQALLEEVAAAVRSGEFPQATTTDPLASQLASTDGAPPPRPLGPGAIDISLFADTGFTSSAIMSMTSELVQRAADGLSGRIQRQEPFDQTRDGLRQQVDLATTMIVEAGGGKVSVDIMMSATDRITNAANGSFVAYYTSTSSGHFEVDACPDRTGVAKGTYTFETKHELNDVSSSAGAARSGAGRAVDAPFSLINGDDARLLRIEATLDLSADARGPGSSTGPGPTGPFDWTAAQTIPIVMPRNGATTATDATGVSVTGTGGERAGGAMFLSSAMAQLFLGQVGEKAETFWRSGKCIELKPSDDTRKVQANETIELRVDATHKFDGGQPVEAPIIASFSGKASLDPIGQPVEAPATFTFVAGPDGDDKGTIDLKQTSRRGIGTRQVVYTVGEVDYRIDNRFGEISWRGLKCGGKAGPWRLDVLDVGTAKLAGKVTFTIPDDGGSAPVRATYVLDPGQGKFSYDLRGTVRFVAGNPPVLSFSSLSGTMTTVILDTPITQDATSPATDLPVEAGAFCQ